jgi:periplasmic mercuric ion binding protein
MKTIIKAITALFLVLICTAGYAQTKKYETIKIKTSAECGTCKKAIEKSLSYEKGVKSVNCDLDTKTVEVTYKPSKTNPETLRKAISNLGYDADDIPANNKAYQKLEECCKKGGMKN